MKNKTVAAIVPMKEHSSRIPNKNIKLINGKPLFYWIINALHNSKHVNDIYVETDSDVIEELVKKYFDIKILRRPQELVGDDVPMNDLIKFHISRISADIYLQTHSTNPLLKPKTIDDAIESFINSSNNYDSLFSVTKLQTRLYTDKGEPINHNPDELLPTQSLPILYEENSNIYIFTKDSFNNNGFKRIGKKPMMYMINKLESLDIDTEEDFYLAEALFSK